MEISSLGVIAELGLSFAPIVTIYDKFRNVLSYFIHCILQPLSFEKNWIHLYHTLIVVPMAFHLENLSSFFGIATTHLNYGKNMKNPFLGGPSVLFK